MEAQLEMEPGQAPGKNDGFGHEEEAVPMPTREELQLLALEKVLPRAGENQGNGLEGYELDCSELRLTGENRAAFVLTVSYNGVIRRAPVTIHFYGDWLGTGENRKYGNLEYDWGGLYAAGAGEIALVTREKICFWDGETLEDAGLGIEAEEGMVFRGLTWHPDFGYIVPVLVDGEEWVVFYDKQGKTSGRTRPDTRGHGLSLGQFERGRKEAQVVSFYQGMMVLDLPEPLVVLQGGHTVMTLFDPEEGLVWDMHRYDTVEEGQSRVELLTSSLLGSGFLPYGRSYSGLALLYEGDKLTDYMYFDASVLPAGEYGAGLLQNGVYQAAQKLLNPYRSDMPQELDQDEEPLFRMSLSVTEKSFVWEYDMDKPLIYSLIEEEPVVQAQSPSGRYQVMAVLRDGGGDGYWGHWVVYDRVEEKLRHLYQYGTLPFAAQEVVFLNETLLGVLCNDGVYFFRADTGEQADVTLTGITFGQTKDTGMTRNVPVSLCARADLAYYALLYLPKDMEVFWTDEEYTHRAALFDRDGRLLADVDTDIPMYRKIYYTYYPVISLEGFALTVESPVSDEVFLVDLTPE